MLNSKVYNFFFRKCTITKFFRFTQIRGMKKFVIASPVPKIFVQVFVHMRSYGALQNKVDLVPRDQVENFAQNTSGLLLKLFKPAVWLNLTPNQGKGFFGEELIKAINLANGSNHGNYQEQTQFGLNPSSGKGPDIEVNKVVYLGPSSDQETLELGLKTLLIESKVTGKTLSGGPSGSLDKRVAKNQWLKEYNIEKEKHLGNCTEDQSKVLASILDEGVFDVPLKYTETKAIGFASRTIQSDREGKMNTDKQELYSVKPQVIEDFIKAFDDPGNSPYAQVE